MGLLKTLKFHIFTYLDLECFAENQKLINQKILNLQPLDQTFYPLGCGKVDVIKKFLYNTRQEEVTSVVIYKIK